MYTSSDNNNDGYYDNYISRALLSDTGPVNQQDFTIQDAANIDLRPNYESDRRGCFIFPLGCLRGTYRQPKGKIQQCSTEQYSGRRPIFITSCMGKSCWLTGPVPHNTALDM